MIVKVLNILLTALADMTATTLVIGHGGGVVAMEESAPISPAGIVTLCGTCAFRDLFAGVKSHGRPFEGSTAASPTTVGVVTRWVRKTVPLIDDPPDTVPRCSTKSNSAPTLSGGHMPSVAVSVVCPEVASTWS